MALEPGSNLALTHGSSVNLGKLLCLSEPLLPPLHSGVNNAYQRLCKNYI